MSRNTDVKECPAGGKHEKYIPLLNQDDYDEGLPGNWNWFAWNNHTITVNMCKKCHLVYWEENRIE